jgi:hypothetical protein
MRVHLGFDADALVIDGPMHTHLVRVEATVRQVQRIGPRLLRIGVAFDHASALDDYQLIAHFVDHLRERAGWAI